MIPATTVRRMIGKLVDTGSLPAHLPETEITGLQIIATPANWQNVTEWLILHN
jgi:hypothetical protein